MEYLSFFKYTGNKGYIIYKAGQVKFQTSSGSCDIEFYFDSQNLKILVNYWKPLLATNHKIKYKSKVRDS